MRKSQQKAEEATGLHVGQVLYYVVDAEIEPVRITRLAYQEGTYGEWCGWAIYPDRKWTKITMRVERVTPRPDTRHQGWTVDMTDERVNKRTGYINDSLYATRESANRVVIRDLREYIRDTRDSIARYNRRLREYTRRLARLMKAKEVQ